MGAAGVPAGRLLSGEFMGWVLWLILWGAGIAGAFFMGAIIALALGEKILGREALFSDALSNTLVLAGGALGVGLLFYIFW